MVKKRSPNSDQWQAVLHLSEELHRLPSLSAKIQAIQETTNNLLHCKTELLLSDSRLDETITTRENQAITGLSSALNQPILIPQIGDKNPQEDLITIEVPLVAHDTRLGTIRCQRNYAPFDKVKS
jgi:hypothetical protein